MSAELTTVLCAAGILLCLAAARWHHQTIRRMRVGELELAQKNQELERRETLHQQLETRYRTLFDSVPVAIVVARIDGTVIDINTAALRLFGFERAEFMTLNLRSLYVNPAERDHRMSAALKETAAKSNEYLLRRRNGSTFPALTQNHIIRNADGSPSHVEGFVSDLTEVKRLESERHKKEQEHRLSTRLQSVGALAAGIAHEINTPMQFVSDSVHFLKGAIDDLTSGTLDAEDLDVNELVQDAKQSVERALEGVRRVTKIIRAMREFAHPDNGERTLVDINHAIETTLIVCKNVYKEVADVETHLGELPPVLCQYGEVNQALLNIIVNAAHAIESRAQRTTKGRIAISTQARDGWAIIRIEDDGTGIPESVKSRIFDPFFTTKEVGKGTGQGLAIVQSVIVERHNGRIFVESEWGKGTAFVLHLPLEGVRPQVTGVEHEQEA
jgi:PAS domain S-box-containing protein